MDERQTPARVVAPRSIVGAPPPARVPFDPAGLLEGRRPPPAPLVTAPPVTVAAPFDPAAYLGERARRGAFNLSTVKPLKMTMDGVELVAVPASAYADALRQIAALEGPAEAVAQPGPVADATGMLNLLLSMHAAEVVSIGQLARATGLDHIALGDLIAARAGLPPFGAAATSEAHGAALDDGRETEAHGAALAAAKPVRHPWKTGTTREDP